MQTKAIGSVTLSLLLALLPLFESAASAQAENVEAPVETMDANSVSLNGLVNQIRDPSIITGISLEMRDHAIEMIERYGQSRGCDPKSKNPAYSCAEVSMPAQVKKTLLQTSLRIKNKEAPGIILEYLFDGMADSAQSAYDNGIDEQEISSSGNTHTFKIHQDSLGRDLGYKKITGLGYQSALITMTKDDLERPGQEYVDGVYMDIKKGAAHERHTLYSLGFQRMLKNIKSIYYDQCSMVRLINNGGSPLALPNTVCANAQGKEKDGLTQEDIQKLLEKYQENRKSVTNLFFIDSHGQQESLLDYLKKLETMAGNGSLKDEDFLKKLNWRDLSAAQRVAQNFMLERKTAETQKALMGNLLQYLGQATSVVPAKGKSGNLGLGFETPEELQKILTQFHQGRLSGHIIKTGVDERDANNVTARIISASGGAMMAMAAAAAAKKRADKLKSSPDHEGEDSALSASDRWLNIAQNYIREIQMESLAEQAARLRNATFQDYLGLTSKSAKKEANKLETTVRDQYLPELRTLSQNSETLAIEKDFSQIYFDLANASLAELYGGQLRKRLRTAQAEIEDIRSLYFAREFEKVRTKYKTKSSMEDMEGVGYQDFRAHLSPQQALIAQELDAIDSSLEEAGGFSDDGQIRSRSGALLRDSFPRLLRDLDIKKVLGSKEIGKKSLRLNIRRSQILSAMQNLTNRMQAFTELNELDELLRENASSKPSLASPHGFWEHVKHLSTFRFMNSAMDKAELGQRDKSVGLMLAHNWLTREAYQKLMANAELRDTVLNLINHGQYDQAFSLIGKLDPEMAEMTLKNHNADKMKEDPYRELSFEGFMTDIPEDKAGTQAQGVIIDLFNNLKPIILGYMVASAVVDTAAMAAYSTFIGGIATGAEGLTRAVIDAGQVLKASEVADEVSSIGRLSNTLGRVLEFTGRTLEGQLLNVRNVLGIEQIGSKSADLGVVQKFAQIARVAPWNALKFQGKNALIMGGVSGAMSAASYRWNPQTSQFHSAKEAFAEGIIGGAAFGVKATPFMLMNPVQASAFGVFGNGISTVVKSVAETPGPVSWVVQTGAKLIPRWAKSTVAESGPLGALQMTTMDLSPAWHAIVRAPIWMGALVDGMSKYFLTSLISQSLVEASDYYYHKKAAPLKDNPETGVTGADRNIASSYQAGQAVSQASWLFLPSASMGNPEQIKNQQEESDGFNVLMRQGRGKEIESLPDDYSLTYEKSLWDMSLKDRISYAKDWISGRNPKRAGTFKVNSQWRQEAAKKRLDKFSDAELAVIASADKKSNDHFFRFEKTAEGVMKLERVDIAQSKSNVIPIKSAKSAKPEALSKEEIANLAAVSELRLSNDLISTARNILERRIAKNAALRAKILEAKDSVELKAESRNSGLVSGPDLEKLKQMAATAQINSKGFLGTLKRNFWNASLHLGRDLETSSDILTSQIAGEVDQKKSSGLKATFEQAGQEPVFDALTKIKKLGEEARATAIEKALRHQGLDSKVSITDTIDILNEKIKSLEEEQALKKNQSQAPHKNESQIQALESLKDKLAQILTDPEADALIESFHKAMDEQIAAAYSSGDSLSALALGQMRKTLESDASTQFINKKLARDFKSYRRKNISQKDMDLSVSLFKSIWERGVFGRHFGKWEVASDGTRTLEIPADRQLKDARGNPITSFRELQARQILSTLKKLSKGEAFIFNQLKTSGGKTLLSFVMLDFLDSYARSRGKLGGMYLTANGDLVAQTMDQYLAIFNGRKPRFKIKTYSDFWAEQATADKYGGSNPLELYDLVLDEYDMMAMMTALSLGSSNGNVSRYPELDPVQVNLREGAFELQKLYEKYSKDRSELNPESFAKLLNDNPEFKDDLDTLIASQTKGLRGSIAKVKSKEYRAQIMNPDSQLYKDLGLKSLEDFKAKYKMTPQQFYYDLLASHQHAFGGGLFDSLLKKWSWGGVIGRQYGKPENWLKKIYSGGYQALSKKDLQNLFAVNVDKNRQEIIQYFNGVPMDNLDTEYRSYLELLHGKPLTLDFDSLAVIDFASFNNKAKAAGSVMLGLSGTLAHSIRPFMEGKMGFKVIGDESAGYGVDYQILRPQGSKALSDNFAREFIMKDIMEKRPNLSILYADNKVEYEALRESLKSSGVLNKEIAIGITPDSNFLSQNRRQTGVEEYKNLEALQSGEAKVLILVGQAGFRGLDLPFGKAYKNGKFRMYISGPENLATVNVKQLMGRIDSGRIPEGVKVTVTGVVDGKILEQSPLYTNIARGRLLQVSENPQKKAEELWTQIADIVKENAEDPAAPISYKTVTRLTSDPKALENPEIVKVRDMFENYRVIKKLSHMIDPKLAKDLLDPKNSQHLEAFSQKPKVADVLIGDLMAKLQDIAEQKAVESSGINRQKARKIKNSSMTPQAPSILRTLFGRKKEEAFSTAH
jgi:hypothetical protein